MADPDPDPQPELYTSDLTPELINKILSYEGTGIRQPKKGRLITPFWRDVIDARPEIVFNVDLRDGSAKWVQNTNARFIQTLRFEGLTKTDFDYELFQAKPKEIFEVMIGPKNSSDNFWKILQLCDKQSVECLEFELHSIPAEEKDSTRLRVTLPSVKTLEMEIGHFKNDIREPEAVSNFLDELSLPCLVNLDFKISRVDLSRLDYDFQMNRMLTAFYDFLNRHTTVRRLELSIFDKYTPDNFSLLPEMDSSMSLDNIEELSLHLDFRRYREVSLSPLIQHCKKLKALTIFSSEHLYHCPKAESVFYQLISQNASTLESLSLNSFRIAYSEIGLEKCTRLRSLKLFVSMSMFRCGETNRIFPKVQILELKYSANLEFRVVEKFLELVGDELEELTLFFSRRFDILHLGWILEKNRFPKIRPTVLSSMFFNIALPIIARFVDETPDIKGECIRGTNGLRDYCITKLN